MPGWWTPGTKESSRKTNYYHSLLHGRRRDLESNPKNFKYRKYDSFCRSDQWTDLCADSKMGFPKAAVENTGYEKERPSKHMHAFWKELKKSKHIVAQNVWARQQNHCAFEYLCFKEAKDCPYGGRVVKDISHFTIHTVEEKKRSNVLRMEDRSGGDFLEKVPRLTGMGGSPKQCFQNNW